MKSKLILLIAGLALVLGLSGCGTCGSYVVHEPVYYHYAPGCY